MSRPSVFIAWLLSLLMLMVAGGAMAGGASGKRDVRVGLYENAPKIHTGDHGRPAGLFVELLDEMARLEGWQLHYVPCLWADCLLQLEAGQLDLMPDVAFSVERARRFSFHKSSVVSSWSQMYVHPDRVVQSIDDLAGLRIAVLQGGIQESFIRQLLEKDAIAHQLLTVKTLDTAYQAVANGEADVVATNRFFAAHQGQKYQLVETPIVFQPATLYFAAPHGKNADLLERIDHHLNDWRRDADSVFFDALRRALAAPPEILIPHWVPWLLAGASGALLLLLVVSMVLRRQVALRTRELEAERATLELQVNQRTAELLAAKEEAERLTLVKSAFLANMSHEIRTPMNAVLGMLYLTLKNDDLPAQARNQLGKAQGAAHALLGIINDILDLSKIEAGKLDIEAIEFGLDAVLEQLADAISFQAAEKGIEFLIRYDARIPSRLVGDPLRIGQILLNLCGNAVKFTPHGEVELAFRHVHASDSEITIQICVRDSGIGIAPEVQQRLFEKFTQADQSTTRCFGGTGLGLAISKHLVEMMHGRIWVEDSQPGVGTTVCFTLRLTLALAAQAHERALIEKAGPLLQGIRVLVVDDSEASREIMVEMLRCFRLDISTAASGAAALAALQAASSSPYDLVLMDWFMPGMNGDQVAQRIHADTTLVRQPKIIMVTAHGREDVLKLLEQAGIDAFLIKPVSPSVLLDTILTVLGRSRLFNVAGTTAAASAASDNGQDNRSRGELAGARLLLVEDNEINREFALELLCSEGIDVDTAENGAVAVAKVQQQDYDAVLMDIQMPVLDGLNATRQIRALAGEQFARLPIIAMTALAMAQDTEQSQAAGMNDHISKPIAPERLLAVLTQWVQRPAAGRPRRSMPSGQLPETLADLPDDLLAQTAFNAREGVRRIGGKVDAYRKQLRRFRENYPDAVNRLRQRIDNEGPLAGEALCHALKGLTGNLGAHALYEVIHAIDAQLRQGITPEPGLLDAAEEQLQRLLQAIDSTNADPSLTPTACAAAGAALAPEAVDALLQRLANALAYDLGAAETLLHALRAGVAGTPLAAPIAAIAAEVEIFNIDAALAQLTSLADGLPAADGSARHACSTPSQLTATDHDQERADR